MSTKERDALQEMMKTFQEIVDDGGSTLEEKQIASEQITRLSGRLASPLFPSGIVRIVLMLGFVGLGFLAFLTPYEWLFWSFLIALAFSPRIMGEVVHGSGRLTRILGTSKQ